MLAGPLVPLSCYAAGTGAGRNASPGPGRDGLGGDAHRFSHSRGIAARAVHAIDANRKDRGNGFLRRAGTSFYVRRRDLRHEHYWTGARRNARADARKPGRKTPPSAKRRAKAANARGLLRKAAGAPTYNA